MRTQENREKYKEYDHKYYIKNRRPRTKIGQLELQIDQLKQQLAEKQNTIDEINKEFVQAVHDWKTLCAEKDREIEKLKQQNTLLENENGKLAKELIVKNYKKAQKEVSFGIQLAIQELEKTLNFIEDVFDKALKNCSLNNCYYDQILDFIDQQIKELKGEK